MIYLRNSTKTRVNEENNYQFKAMIEFYSKNTRHSGYGILIDTDLMLFSLSFCTDPLQKYQLPGGKLPRLITTEKKISINMVIFIEIIFSVFVFELHFKLDLSYEDSVSTILMVKTWFSKIHCDGKPE